MNLSQSICLVLPEIVLVCGAMALLMLGVYREGSAGLINVGAILLLVAAAIIAALLPAGAGFGGSFVVDSFGRFLKVLAFGASAAAILLSLQYLSAERQRFEYSILILLSASGMGMLISAADLIALYLGLELMSLALYVVASYSRDN